MRAANAFVVFIAPILASCASTGDLSQPQPQMSSSAQLPSKIKADQLVGAWGLASYHQEGQRARTITAARGQCKNPYRIAKGPGGGVLMHLADEKELSELQTKGGPDGKDYVGPEGPVSEVDREIASFDGKVMTLKWIDPSVSSRFGTMVYVRC